MTSQARIHSASTALNIQHQRAPTSTMEGSRRPRLMCVPLALLPSGYRGIGEVREIDPDGILDADHLANIMKKFSLATPAKTLFPKHPFTNLHDHLDSVPSGEWTRTQRLQGALTRGDGNLFRRKRFNLLAALTCDPNLLIKIGLHLHPKDVLGLYSVSFSFHYCIKNFLLSSIGAWSQVWAPDAFALIPWSCDSEHPFWRPGLSQTDPCERIRDQFPRFQNPAKFTSFWRLVPTMRYYQFITFRQETASEILATLARSGLRVPRTTLSTLLKTWQLMEIPTNAQRKSMMENRRVFEDGDLVNLQIFIVKLLVRFNDPYCGGTNPLLMCLFLGQKGLFPLWQMLFGHKYRNTLELIQLKLRYDYDESYPGWTKMVMGNVPLTPGGQTRPCFGVPVREIGKVSKEFWGQDPQHQDPLLRVDQLLARESTVRSLGLEKHLIHFFLWGHVDLHTGENLAPTEREIYIHDAKFKSRSLDTSHGFGMMECMKARWADLSLEDRQSVLTAQDLGEDFVKALGELASLGNQGGQDKTAFSSAMDRFQKLQQDLREEYSSKVVGLVEEKLTISGSSKSRHAKPSQGGACSDSDDERYDNIEAELNDIDGVDFSWSPVNMEPGVFMGADNSFVGRMGVDRDDNGWDVANFDHLMEEIWWAFPSPPAWSELSQNAWAGFRREDDEEEEEKVEADQTAASGPQDTAAASSDDF